MIDKIRKRFDNWARYYDRSPLQFLLFSGVHKKVYSTIKQWLGKEKWLLDVACGTGRFARYIAKQHPHVTVLGCDLSPKMITKALAKGGQVFWKVAKAERLPYNSELVDVIVCITAFHHFHNQAKAVAEMYRVLKPGGHIVIVDGNINHIVGWFIYKGLCKIRERYAHRQTKRGMILLLHNAGFKVYPQKTFGLIPSVMTIGVK